MEIWKKEWEIILNYIYSLYIKIYVHNMGMDISENIKYKIPDCKNIEDGLKLYEAVDYLDMQNFKGIVRVKIQKIFEHIDSGINELQYILNDIKFIYPEFKKSIAYGIIRIIMGKMIDQDTFNEEYKEKYNSIYEYHKYIYIEIENILNTNSEYFKEKFGKYIASIFSILYPLVFFIYTRREFLYLVSKSHSSSSTLFHTTALEILGYSFPFSIHNVAKCCDQLEAIYFPNFSLKYSEFVFNIFSISIYIKKTRGYNIENIEAHHKFMNNIEIDEEFDRQY